MSRLEPDEDGCRVGARGASGSSHHLLFPPTTDDCWPAVGRNSEAISGAVTVAPSVAPYLASGSAPPSASHPQSSALIPLSSGGAHRAAL